MINFSPVRCDESAYADYVDLFSQCFPGNSRFTREYLDWLYRCNPDGRAVGVDAWDGNRLAAHYVCIPARAYVGGVEVSVLLSLNTATLPAYQGKGLFTQLAERTYAAGLEQGFDCVYGVANANSTPGFTRKLKFQLVGPLDAKVGLGSLGIDFTSICATVFRRSWSQQALAWRCACPVNSVVVRSDGVNTQYFAPALLGHVCMASAEIGVANASTDGAETLVSPLRLFLGKVPLPAQRMSLYINIPHKLRPSPLNLIYRSLSGRLPAIDGDAVFLNFLDFDAY